MSAVPKRLLTPQEYLIRERRAEFKSEFHRGEMFAMSGASRWHSLIGVNLTRVIGNQLQGGPCVLFNSDMRVKVSPTGLYTYPDATVVCDEAKFEDEVFDTLLNPTVVVEVLSDSTEGNDRGDKFGHYRNISSLREYVLVSQKQPLAETFVRRDDGAWVLHAFVGMESTLAFESVPVRIPLTDVYAGVAFAAPSDEAPPTQTM